MERHQRVGEPAMRVGKIRPDGDGPLVMRYRVRGSILGSQRVAKPAMGIRTIASQRHCLVIGDLRVLRAPEQQQHRAEMQPHIDTLGVGIDRTTQQRQCILELAGAGI
jgi:hypothetical protein